MWNVLVAASTGAAVPLIFGHGRLAQGRAWRSVFFVILAGYLAAFVFEIKNPNHAFVMGMGLDLLLGSIRLELQPMSNGANDDSE